jgi:AraC-like DNA-binding protein
MQISMTNANAFAARASRPVRPEFPPWGIFILESHHASGFRMPETAHDFFKIMLVLDGAGQIVAPASRHPIHKGDVVAVPAGFRHRIEDDPRHPLALIVLCIQNPVLAAARDVEVRLTNFRILRNAALTGEIRRMLRQLFFEQSLQHSACATMMRGISLQLVATLARAQGKDRLARRERASPQPSSPEIRVLGYVKELEQKFGDNEKIDNVAERLGLSRRYFTRLFRSKTGASWLNYVRDLRLKHARMLLQKTDRSIAIIAFECGFEDLSSFYRAFKAKTGVPPQKWREKRTT